VKVLFDTNIYISWIRNRQYSDLMLDYKTIKYLSGVVLMELRAGAGTRKAARIIEKIQVPYIKAGRVVSLHPKDLITAGRMISDMPESLKNKISTASFLNDIFIALNAVSIGGIVHTENREDFRLIKKYLPKLRLVIQ
jgi:predicted nucleic acid-binding protein